MPQSGCATQSWGLYCSLVAAHGAQSDPATMALGLYFAAVDCDLFIERAQEATPEIERQNFHRLRPGSSRE
jgi:hypothetical protein